MYRAIWSTENKRDTEIYEEQSWKTELSVDLGLRPLLTWDLPLLRRLIKIHLQGLIMTEVRILKHFLSLLPCGLSFASSHDWTQKASDVHGSFKCNDRRSQTFWTLLAGTYGVNNRWHPVNDPGPAHFCFRRSFKMTAVAQHWEAYAVMYVKPILFSVPHKE